jgi:hypothetical protein
MSSVRSCTSNVGVRRKSHAFWRDQKDKAEFLRPSKDSVAVAVPITKANKPDKGNDVVSPAAVELCASEVKPQIPIQ